MSADSVSMSNPLSQANTDGPKNGLTVDLSLQFDQISDLIEGIDGSGLDEGTDGSEPFEEIDGLSQVQWQQWFTVWLNLLKPDYSPIQSYELSVLLTTDAAIQTLNRQYRQLDKPTNVLAFALLDGDSPPPDVLAMMPMELGDIVISVETAQRQAIEHNHSLGCELAWLASHGLLHLLGWDHPNDDELQQMLDQQAALLQAAGFEISDQFYYAAQTY